MGYTEEELHQLHKLLYELLGEVVRVCQTLGINYFILGGTAIGAYFHKGIIPWDDDIDIGMLREDYDRFLEEAPNVLGDNYLLQWFGTERKTPFYYAKVRKNGTAFLEEDYEGMNIHHGIFLDIFPFDRVPDDPGLELKQRRRVQFCEGGFKRQVSKKCVMESLSFVPSSVRGLCAFFYFALLQLIPRHIMYWRLVKAQTKYNALPSTNVSIVKMPLDQIPVEDVIHCTDMPFGRLTVKAPCHLEKYLTHHYPGLTAFPPENERINHRPKVLSFTGNICQ